MPNAFHGWWISRCSVPTCGGGSGCRLACSEVVGHRSVESYRECLTEKRFQLDMSVKGQESGIKFECWCQHNLTSSPRKREAERGPCWTLFIDGVKSPVVDAQPSVPGQLSSLQRLAAEPILWEPC